jgi:hypothetical protein
MRKSDNPTSRDYDDYVASALGTEGGHLSIGRGGFTLYYAHGARLSGYDCEQVKACCIAAGLPVIDSRKSPSRTSCASPSADRWRRSAKRRARRLQPYYIRRQLTEGAIRAADKRAQFVGVANYGGCRRHRDARSLRV